MLKVSVVVPIYGVEKYLRQCVDSILAQTLKDIEIILVDDGSPDGCPAIVDEYAAKDSRVIAVHQENGGYGRAVNHGIEIANGEYIGIVEPDDWIEPLMYERLYVEAHENDLDVMKGNFTSFFLADKSHVPKPTKWVEMPPEGKVLTTDDVAVFFSDHPSVWSCIYKRSFVEAYQIRMIESKGAAWQDNPFQVQTLCLAKRIGFTPQSYYNYRIFAPSPSAALKNWRIPFDRTKEIHAWLKQNGFFRPPIISWLGRRELFYLTIVAEMKTIDDWDACGDAIRSVAEDLPIEPVLSTLPSKKRPKIEKLWSMAKTSPKRFRRQIQRNARAAHFKRVRKWFVSVKIKKATCTVVFIGRLFSFSLSRGKVTLV